MAINNLAFIQQKVRRLTRSPSQALLTDAQLNDYINTFYLYNFPQHLRTFILHKTLTWYCDPNVAEYKTLTMPTTHPLFDFKNKYINTNKPVYVAGYVATFSQSRDQFFGAYPFINFIQRVATGDGVNNAFSGTLTNVPVLQNQVTFTTINNDNGGMELIDLPVDGENGVLVVPNTSVASGAINYLTGQWSIFGFPTPPANTIAINAQYVPYQPARPQAVLFFEDTFTLRPVPDQPYRLIFEVAVTPTEFFATTDHPALDQWCQFLAYGAAKLIFEDRMDLDSVALIMPEFKMQELLVNRTTIVQNSTQRSATIYSENAMLGSGYGWNYGNSMF